MNAKRILNLLMVPAILLLIVVVVGCTSTSSPPAASTTASPSSPREQFASPDAAAQTLVNALRAKDEARLDKILAPDGDDILSSGDPIADQADVQRFLKLYDEGHHFEKDAAGVNTLVVGSGGWPFPVPIVKSGNKFEFDVDTGEEEILNRRIGRNELSTEQVCLAIHGYRYRLLTSQGPHAEGGATDYIVDGKLIGGFGVIAYPAQYGNSGIMTFITNHDGVVYQRDLGPDSQKIAEGITQFDPGPEWTKSAEGSQPTTQPD